ncbi:reverse transcriptase domain-containing protein [Tanacetum coccineum]
MGQMLFPSSVPDTELVLYPLQDRLTSGYKSGNGYPRKGQKSKPKRQNRARERKERKEKSKSKPTPPVVTMDDNRTMAQLLEAPIEGYEDAIVVPEITADNFELKHDHFYDEVPERPEYVDSLNSAAGGNFLDKMPWDCLRIIESKSKVRNSHNKPVVAKVSASISTPGISPDVAELKDMVKALLLDKKSQAPAPVKAVEECCVTCGGAHSYRNCPATDGSVYRDNIQEYVSQAATANFNQGNTGYRAPIANQIRPPGTLPSNTITNPKVDLKGITTRSSVAYQGPTIPATTSSPPRVVERETEPVVAPVSAPMPNLKPSIPYPSRRNDERRHEKANDQIEKFYEIFKDLSFEISLTDALILMPKFASTLKALIGNKEKLSEMARTPLNEHCSAVLLKKLPEKLGDPDKFLIPCNFPGMDECLALADLGASIYLMPLSVCKKLSLSELTPTCMTFELADRSITQPIGIAEDVDVKVGKFQFSADFVVVDFDADPRVPLILGRSFLKTGRALIDVYEGELTLGVGKESNVLGFSNVIVSGNPTPYYDPIVSTSSPTLTPFGDSKFFLEEVDGFLAIEDDPTSPEVNDSYYDPEGDILLIESFLNDDQSVKLKDVLLILDYAFLEGNTSCPFIISKDLSVEEKAALIKVLKSHKRAIAWKLSDIKGINPEFCTHEILMEEDYKPAVQHQRQSHFMVKEGIVLGHKISKNGIEVDKAKVDVIAKLPHPTTVKGVRSFLGHAGFYRRFIKDFSKISRPMTHLLEKNTPFIFSNECIQAFETLKKKLTEAPILIAPDWDLPFELMCDASDFAIGAVLGQRHEKHFRPIHYASKTMNEAESHYTTTEKEMLAVVYAFEKFRSYLILNKSIVYTDHSALKYLFAKKDSKARLLRWVLLLQEFKFKVIDTKGAENLTADHLSRLENPYENVLDPKEINEKFPLETLNMVTFRGDSSTPWFADYANYHAGNFIVKGMSSQQKNKFFKDAKKLLTSSQLAIVDPPGDITVPSTPPKKFLTQDFIGPRFTEMPMTWSPDVTLVSIKEKFRNVMKCLKIPSKFAKSLTCGASISWGRSRLHDGTNIYLWPSTTCQNGLKRKRSPPTTPELFANFLNLSSPDSVPLVLS